MAGTSTLLERLRGVAAHLDDEALAALANKGLLRRAYKDLEAGPPTAVGPHEGYFRFQLADCAVDLAESPALSRCSCPASGVCRHILLVMLSLRQSTPEIRRADSGTSSAGATAAADMLAVDDQELQKWAGKALVRKAMQTLARGMPAEIEGSGAVVVRFPAWNIVCRWIPGSGLTGMICSCHAREPCEHRVASVLAYQAAHGKRDLGQLEAAVLEASAGAPRTREEVRESVAAVLREIVALGLSRVSNSTEERLRTLAVSAHGVDLPRLERMLRALADEVRLFLARDAQASSAALLLTAARIETLRFALDRPTAARVGVHRSQYERVGDIELVGMGARQWLTRSGYVGLTVYFWDRSARSWATWTEARPATVKDFDPVARYQQDGPWTGCSSPALAGRHCVRLQGAWRNRAGRLSGRPSTRALVLGPSVPHEIPGWIDRWADLAIKARRLFAGGLQERAEQDELVLVKPHQWGPAQFDSIRQQFVRPIADRDGRSLFLVLPFTPQTEQAVRLLETCAISELFGLLGILHVNADRLAVEPVVLFGDKGVTSLTLDHAAHASVPQPASADVGEEQEILEEEEATPSSSPVGLLLARMAEALENVSEAGLSAAADTITLRRLATQADSLGLTACSCPLLRLAEELDRIRKSMGADARPVAGTLLHAYYAVRFADAQEAIDVALAGMVSQREPPSLLQ
jgi:hypothetical protein